MSDQPLWTPSTERVLSSRLAKFAKGQGQSATDYQSLLKWSIERNEDFWSAVWDFCEVIGDKGDVVLKDADKMPGAHYFPEASLNYAENCLRRRDGAVAMIFRDELGNEDEMSFAALYDAVSLFAQALKAQGVVKGDRVAGYMPNMKETIIAMLAAVSLGAIWSSASPDFGVQGVIDRFGQIEPKVLVSVDGYYYNGKTLSLTEKLSEVMPQLPSVEQVVVVPFTGSDVSSLSGVVMYSDFVSSYEAQDIVFERVAFNHPLFIMFSSGTTGVPKCIVHGHGGTLLQHLKEFHLQCDIGRDDRVFYFTTCGWMMWNWLVTALACEATLLLYDGSPFYPDGEMLWDFTSRHKCKLFGTSAKYIDALKANDIYPKDKFDLSAMTIITSTGSPLVHESFDFVYEHIKEDVHLASIYGGTDIISASFGIGNPISPVYRGEIQGPALGMDVQIFDEAGRRIVGKAGELVCVNCFPSMPVGFWNDDGTKYHKAYFERYENVWHHGDWVEESEHHGLVIHGRSDATLNPGGVRIGTAEIYRQVEKLPQVLESIAVGQDWDGDVRVILFVVLKDGITLDDDLIKAIKAEIRQGASPRHVPSKVIQVSDIPRTKSNKIVEIAVRQIIHGREVQNVEALANPEALNLYRDLPALKEA